MGVRLLAELGRLDLHAGGRAGQAVGRATEGRWLQGDLVASTGLLAGPAALRFTAGAFGLGYIDPFSYSAAGGELRPEIAFTEGGRTTWILSPRLTAGSWAADSLEGSLWIGGGSVEGRRPLGRVDAWARLDLLDVANGVTEGAFLRAGAGGSVTRGGWTLGGEVAAQRTPLETEIGGSISLFGALSPELAIRLEAARLLRDPLFGTPGNVGISAGVSVRPLHLAATAAVPVVTVGERRNGARAVWFRLRAPEAERVELSGDFTGWEPVSMEPRGDQWTLELTLPPGLHHFGFLVDGEWAVPPDAPGLVDDGWGRLNASVVIDL